MLGNETIVSNWNDVSIRTVGGFDDTSMGWISESEPLRLDPDWNRPLIGDRERSPLRYRRGDSGSRGVGAVLWFAVRDTEAVV